MRSPRPSSRRPSLSYGKLVRLFPGRGSQLIVCAQANCARSFRILRSGPQRVNSSALANNDVRSCTIIRSYFSQVEALLRKSLGVSETAKAVNAVKPAPPIETGPIGPSEPESDASESEEDRKSGIESEWANWAGTLHFRVLMSPPADECCGNFDRCEEGDAGQGCDARRALIDLTADAVGRSFNPKFGQRKSSCPIPCPRQRER